MTIPDNCCGDHRRADLLLGDPREVSSGGGGATDDIAGAFGDDSLWGGHEPRERMGGCGAGLRDDLRGHGLEWLPGGAGARPWRRPQQPSS